jgi:O-antigen ligase
VLWTLLPQRAEVADGFAAAGTTALPWMPISLDPDATLAVLASLLVPAAGVALFAAASLRGLRRALATVVAVAIGSMMLGLLQLIGGEGTALQPYAITNPGKATGLFANRNHLATLLVMAIPCAVLLAGQGNRLRAGVLALILAGGTALTGSKAGIGLAVVTAAVSLAAIHAPARAREPWLALFGAGALLGAAGAAWLALAPVAPPAGGIEQQRPFIIATTLDAARDHFPAGSGGGSFLRVYQHYEDPAAISPEYRNHAHNDYAEVLLEYGAPGAVLMLAVIGWWAVAAFAVWRSGPGSGAARAGIIMLGVVLAHSLVDYPLRTAGLALLAAAAAVIAARRGEAALAPVPDQSEAPEEDPRHLRVTL